MDRESTPNAVDSNKNTEVFQRVLPSREFRDMLTVQRSPATTSTERVSVNDRVGTSGTRSTTAESPNSERRLLFRPRTRNFGEVSGAESAELNYTKADNGRASKRPRRSKCVSYNDTKGAYASFRINVFLLPNSKTSNVPRGKERTLLHEQGHIVNDFEIQKAWEEEKVRCEILKLFGKKMEPESRFRFLRASYLSLVNPVLAPGETFNGRTIQQTWKKTFLFIQPEKCLEVDESNLELEDAVSDRLALSDEELPDSSIKIDGDNIEESQNEAPTEIHSEVAQRTPAPIAPVQEVPTSSQGLPVEDIDPEVYTSNITRFEDVFSNCIETPHEPVSDTTLKQILEKLKETVNSEAMTDFNINRANVVECALRAIKRKRFDPHSRINVIFTDDADSAERAVDSGGPTREFLRLLIKEITACPVFEGHPKSRYLSLNSYAKSSNMYFYAGLVMAYAIVHGGPAPKCLSPILYESLYKDPTKLKLKVTDLEHTENLRDFKKGLNTLNVLEMICKYPNLFQKIMIWDNVELSWEHINSLFRDVTLSERGSNRYQVETKVIGYFRDFLIEVEDGETMLSLKDVLVFATGADEEPPMGFDTRPSITFLHDNYRDTNKPSMFPMANTSALELQLPITHQNYEAFRDALIEGIAGSSTFGQP